MKKLFYKLSLISAFFLMVGCGNSTNSVSPNDLNDSNLEKVECATGAAFIEC